MFVRALALPAPDLVRRLLTMTGDRFVLFSHSTKKTERKKKMFLCNINGIESNVGCAQNSECFKCK